MFLTDKLLDSLAGEIGEYAENYIMENGPAYVETQIEKEITGIEGKTLADVRSWVPADKETICGKIRDVYLFNRPYQTLAGCLPCMHPQICRLDCEAVPYC